MTTTSARYSGLARAALAGLLVAVLAACVPATESGTGTARDGDPAARVTVAMSVPASQWDPIATVNEVADNMYFSLLYDRLLTVGANGEIVPQLATGYTVSADGRSVRLDIRPGATFQDGSPIDAAAVVANLERARTSGKAVASSRLAGVTAVRAEGTAVVLDLAAPDPALPAELTSVALSIAAPSAFGRLGTEPVGSGPYRLDRAGQDRVSFTRYDGYWDRGPRAAGFDVVAIPTTSTRLNALRSGEIDWAFVNLDAAAEIKQFQSDPAYRVTQVPTRSVFALNLDTRVKPLDDPQVRQALSAAIDRNLLNNSLLGGMCPPSVQPLAAGPGHLDNAPAGGPDVAQARATIAARAPGLVLPTVVANGTAAATLAAALQPQLAEIGVTMRINSIDGRSARPEFRSGHFAALLQQVNAEVDPLLQLQLNYAGPDAPGGASPQLAGLLAAAGQPPLGSPQRTEALEAVSRDLVAQPVHVVICGVPNTYIAAADVVGTDKMPMSDVLNPADVRTLMKVAA
ncbi:peptide/nickel transport system substrate-binding protein [Amycolatopsis bartoniae]|uniref:Solute-binding protein family 5 domain-containing protein n=1 Tax=Amycolatopsis bartoniae TaxID=941986 RepID=A0A8H9ISI4_9PSEU|nr:ABC transporter substrate-binding protein [Amycolatopsis bartoniae]MBB2939748.1 peptide/nickel transport system substrate-binding protein [Amycolatopsis bartoniae]TVT08355.1 ABC transporter substrate-binding protein [Amycolatopsis bartoniae]GHF36087.1 hypothetical protein GCM10017566_06400 [Amycolatopsis bartoniae]